MTGRIRTHDDMRDFLRQVALGARVDVAPLLRTPSSGRFWVWAHGAPRPACDVYTLPCDPDAIARRVRELIHEQ